MASEQGRWGAGGLTRVIERFCMFSPQKVPPAPQPRGQSRDSGVDSGMPALRAGDAMQECTRSRSWTANTRLVERLKATDDEIARQPARVRCGDQINAIM